MYDHRAAVYWPSDGEPHHEVHDVVDIRVGRHDRTLGTAIEATAGSHATLTDVVDVRPAVDGNRIASFDVVGRDGAIIRARDILVSTVPTPALPEGIYGSRRVWHSAELPARLGGLALERPARFIVVGAGRDAAEATDQLLDRFPRAYVRSVFDDARIADVHDDDDEVVALMRSAPGGPIFTVRADAIVFATGFRPQDPARLLGSAVAYCRRDARGNLRIGTDRRVQTTEHVEGAIYVHEATRPSEATPDADEVVGSLLAHSAQEMPSHA